MAASAAAMESGEKPRKAGEARSVASKRRRCRSATSSCGTRRDGDGDGGDGAGEGVDMGQLAGLGRWARPGILLGFEREGYCRLNTTSRPVRIINLSRQRRRIGECDVAFNGEKSNFETKIKSLGLNAV